MLLNNYISSAPFFDYQVKLVMYFPHEGILMSSFILHLYNNQSESVIEGSGIKCLYR